MHTARLAALLLMFISVCPTDANACSCAAPGKPCQELWRADAVFSGRVVSLDSSGAASSVNATGNVQFEMLESFRGPYSSTVVVANGGNCGYAFRSGESYFVYAYKYRGALTVTMCTRTRLLRDAAEDLAYARSLSAIRPGTPARVAGTVEVWNPPVLVNGVPDLVATKAREKRMPGILVTATGEGHVVNTTTNDRGEFVLTGIALGKYEITADAPAGFEAVPTKVELFDPRGCGTVDLILKYDGRITGRVVDHRGRPMRGLPLELVLPQDIDKRGGGGIRSQTWTKADGTFELRLISPGEYVLGFNSIVPIEGRRMLPFALYPGVTESTRAERVIVPARERVQLHDFVVPEGINLVTVSGIVVDEAGRPVPATTINLSDGTEGPNAVGTRFLTDEDGRFAFSLVHGARYELHARPAATVGPNEERRAGMALFRASATTSELVVVLRVLPKDPGSR